MRQIFVDTGAWDAIADGGDPHHELALLFRDEIAGQCRLVTTNLKQKGISEAFAFDQHFAQMGFDRRP